MSIPSPFDFLYDIPRVDFCAEGLHYLPCVRYARENPRQYMDCIFKDGLNQYPVLIWVHGGGWGDEYNTPCYRPEPALLELADRGWFIACIEYRLAQHGAFPVPMLDCQKAVAWLRENADRFRLDPGLFAMWGESAGAHLACMVGANYNHMENADVQAIVSWYCPSDLASEIDSHPDPAEESFYTDFLGGEWLERHEEEESVALLRYAHSRGINIVDCSCEDRCPFGVKIADRMTRTVDLFGF